ncbi:DUF2269 family protein [Zestomonas carbonaria]|uniref:DUF2269 domain-containing protein n=1 Tax=Zestomonas carbonaria TaxID=2762745 RepID=A0A7U7EJA8_9GAMM|nr:DUF2269 family protein [Pseudomonas carbonaria]CAD5106083.1 hypothetical protein PSEWESI4_00342 [Pseudomonas carbonaria]
MDTVQTLDLALIGGTALLLLVALGLAWYAWRALRSDGEQAARQLRLVGWGGWALVLLSILSLPVSAWWLAHLQPWPLSALWLLGGTLLYIPAFFAWLLLAGRLQRLQAAVRDNGELAAPQRATLVMAALTFVLFAVLLVLVIAKPV